MSYFGEKQNYPSFKNQNLYSQFSPHLNAYGRRQCKNLSIDLCSMKKMDRKNCKGNEK